MREQLQTHTVLLAEHDQTAREENARYLRTYFKQVWLAADADEAWHLHLEHHPDVFIVNVDLPKPDGLALCEKIRDANKSVRIVLLTEAQTDPQRIEQVEALEVTAMLTKPVRVRKFKEALEKVAADILELNPHMIRINAQVTWDENRQTLEVNKHPVSLSTRETQLMGILVKHIGSCVGYHDMVIDIWGKEDEGSREMLRTQINQLRKKLPHDLIQSVYGKGYVLSHKR